MGSGEITRKSLLDRDSKGEENMGEGKELYREGTFQYQRDETL